MWLCERSLHRSPYCHISFTLNFLCLLSPCNSAIFKIPKVLTTVKDTAFTICIFAFTPLSGMHEMNEQVFEQTLSLHYGLTAIIIVYCPL